MGDNISKSDLMKTKSDKNYLRDVPIHRAMTDQQVAGFATGGMPHSVGGYPDASSANPLDKLPAFAGNKMGKSVPVSPGMHSRISPGVDHVALGNALMEEAHANSAGDDRMARTQRLPDGVTISNAKPVRNP